MKKKLIALAVALCLISAFLSATITLYATPSSNTFTISSGIYPTTTTYTIYKEGSYYYAKNAYGVIDFSNPDAAMVIQSAIDAVYNSGLKGEIVLFPDTYPLGNTTLQLKSGVTLRSLGISEFHEPDLECVLEYTGTGYAVQFLPTKDPSGNTRCVKAGLKGVTINGTSNGAGGIHIGDGANLTFANVIEDVVVRNFPNGDGLFMDIWGIYNTVNRFYANINVKIGIHLKGKTSYPKAACNVNHFENVWVTGNVGIYTEGECGNNIFIDSVIGGCTTGIKLTGTNTLFSAYANVFLGVWFEGNTVDIELTSGTRDNIFLGLQFSDSYAISDSGTGNIFQSGACYASYSFGFSLPKQSGGTPRVGSTYFDAATGRLYIYNGTTWLYVPLNP